MKQLLIATQNKHKIAEYKAMLEPLGYLVKTLLDYPDILDIEETGTTLQANALIKAKTLSDLTLLDVIADDSGLAVDALDGAPGVYSARYAGKNVSYEDNNRKLLADMVGQSNRTAQFVTVICLYERTHEPRYYTGILSGTIATEHRGTNGFGYDPIFVLEDGRHLAELSMIDKNAISHRSRALVQLVNDLEDRT